MLMSCRIIVFAALLGFCAVPLMGAEGTDGPIGLPGQPVGLPGAAVGLPGAPVGAPGAPVGLPGLPSAPTAGAFPSFPGAGAPPVGLSAVLPGAAPAVPSLPSLPGGDAVVTSTLANLADALQGSPAADSATTGGASTTGEIPTYAFLFREMEDGTVRREKYLQVVAETEVLRNEIDRLTLQLSANTPQGVDPRAAALWDFYFHQLELYYRYVRDSVLVGVDSVDEPTYDTTNYAQERIDLENAYKQAAQFIVNKQYNENLEFYDRLQQREDRRRAFYEWLAANQRRVDEQAADWGRVVNGSNWAAGELPTNTADWYYGVNFAAEGGVAVTVDGVTYLLSREPLKRVPPGQVNITSTNLSPYDIVNRDGTMKTAASERARELGVPGTAVSEPGGTIRIVP
jgi:hypothetical protein